MKIIEFLSDHKKEVVGVLGVIIGVFMMIYIQIVAKPVPENYEQKLKELCKDVPPDSQMQGLPTLLGKEDRGTYTIKFLSKMTYQQIKEYYSNLPSLNGWKTAEHSSYSISDYREVRYLNFINTDRYELEIETTNLDEDNSPKYFAVTCSWSSY